MTTVLGHAGFDGVTIEPVDAPMRFGSDLDDAFGFVSTLGMTRGLLQDLAPDDAAAAVEALRQALAAAATDDGVVLGSAAWLITARS